MLYRESGEVSPIRSHLNRDLNEVRGQQSNKDPKALSILGLFYEHVKSVDHVRGKKSSIHPLGDVLYGIIKEMIELEILKSNSVS